MLRFGVLIVKCSKVIYKTPILKLFSPTVKNLKKKQGVFTDLYKAPTKLSMYNLLSFFSISVIRQNVWTLDISHVVFF